MTLPTPRLYRDPSDLAQIRRLLITGRQANTSTFYAHSGDISWWLFYQDYGYTWTDKLFLWDDPAGGDILGWALVAPHQHALDMAARPDQWATGAALAMLAWAEAQMIQRAAGQEKLSYQIGVEEQESQLLDYLTRNGYVAANHSLNFTRRSLTTPLPPVQLPTGFVARSVQGLEEVGACASAQRAAFQSSMPFDKYLERYQTFMASPVYDRQHDVVIAAPDGRIVAFCIVWPEAETGLGLLEPLGVHPDFQRQGLGRAIVAAALHTLRAAGMREAQVGYDSDNPAAKATYLGAGFVAYRRLLLMEKEVILAPAPE